MLTKQLQVVPCSYNEVVLYRWQAIQEQVTQPGAGLDVRSSSRC